MTRCPLCGADVAPADGRVPDHHRGGSFDGDACTLAGTRVADLDTLRARWEDSAEQNGYDAAMDVALADDRAAAQVLLDLRGESAGDLADAIWREWRPGERLDWVDQYEQASFREAVAAAVAAATPPERDLERQRSAV